MKISKKALGAIVWIANNDETGEGDGEIISGQPTVLLVSDVFKIPVQSIVLAIMEARKK